jgi:hypothetical protein
VRPLAPSQAADPESFEQGRAAAADCFAMVADDARAEGRAEERGRIAGWLIDQGATDLGIRVLDLEDELR